MFRRTGRLIVSIALLASTFVVAGTVDPVAEPIVGAPPTATALNTVNILFDRPGNTPVFGPGEVVEIFAGNINYIGGKVRLFGSSELVDACTANAAGTAKRSKPGVDDYLQPFADIYLYPAGQEPNNSDPLTDIVSGTPNTVYGGLGGSFLFEALGATAPVGKIRAGVYGLVIDECQNGVFDSLEDTFIDDAFSVDLGQDVPPLSPATAAFIALKEKAKVVDTALFGVEYLMKLKAAYSAAKEMQGALQAAVSPQAFASYMITQGVAAIEARSPYNAAVERSETAIKTAINNYRQRVKGIAADPPQTDFRRAAVPIPAGADFEEGDDPMFEAFDLWGAQHDAVSAVSGALLDAIERYQGADQVGDAEWAIRHARAVAELTVIYQALQADYDAATAALNAQLALLQGNSTERAYMVDTINRANAAIAGLSTTGVSIELSATAQNSRTDIIDVRSRYNVWNANTRTTVANSPASWTTIINDVGAELDAFAPAVADFAMQTNALIAPLAATLGDLDDDPTIDIAVSGAPVAGATVTLSVTGNAGLDVTWDLDGDGVFDDATGVTTPWTIPGNTMVGAPIFVSAQAGNDDQFDSAVELVVVQAGGNRAPEIDDDPTRSVIEFNLSTTPAPSATLSISASDPDGDSLTYSWLVDGVEVPGATSSTFVFTPPTDATGSFLVEPIVRDGFATTKTLFFVRTFANDADGDGYFAAPAGPDCLDVAGVSPSNPNGVNPVSVNPSRLEVSSNGVDDDCDGVIDEPTTGGMTVNIQLNDAPGNRFVVSEGDQVAVRPNWVHGRKLSGDTFRFTMDWGDGTVDTTDVAGTTVAQTAVEFDHIYDDDQLALKPQVCFEWLADTNTPKDKLCTTLRIDVVFNDRPIVNPADFRTWGAQQRGGPLPFGSYAGDWLPIDPAGKTIVSNSNTNNLVVRTSPNLISPTGYGRVTLNHQLIDAVSDRDLVGVLFGYNADYDDPATVGVIDGEFFNPNADIIGVTWNVEEAGIFNPRSYCTAAPNTPDTANPRPDPFQIWRQNGQPDYYELVWKRTFNYPGSANARCSDGDANGYEVLATVPTALDVNTLVGANTWTRRSLTEDRPQFGTKNPFLVEYDYQPRSITVWINGVEHLTYTVPVGDPDLPPTKLTVAYQSQSSVEVSASAPTETFPFVEGTGGDAGPRGLDGLPVDPAGISLPMHDGAGDTHEARIDWGDGTSTTEGIVTPDPATGNGWFTITGTHTYDEAGTYTGNVCATDDEGLGSCFPFIADVANALPVVQAGPDIAVGALVDLADIAFQDPGIRDTHTATIDWNTADAAPPVTATVVNELGSGIVSGTHTFAADGPVDVEVCVTDNHGGVACDSRTLDVRITNASPVATVLDGEIGDEGGAVTMGVGWTDQNVDETHTVRVNWGDGSAIETVPVQQSGVGCTDNDPDANVIDAVCELAGQGVGTHTYADNGDYAVSAEICDSDDLCDTAVGTVTVDNVAPTLTVGSSSAGRTVSLSGTYSDVGVLDTHRMTVDWGDGTAVTDVAVSGGTLAASHTYASNGQFTIAVCVVDDDGASTCVEPGTAVKTPFIVSLTPARLLDTRSPAGNGATIDGLFLNLGKRPAKSVLELDVLGRGGVPVSGVDAIVLNLTVTGPDAAGHLTMYPCGTKPNASSLNYQQNDIANEVIVKLSPTGKVCIATHARTHIVADTVGYIPTGSDYRALAPARLLDTRSPAGNGATIDGLFLNLGKRPAKSVLELDVLGRGGVPVSGVDAIVLNLTVTGPDAAGHLTMYPCGTKPNASSLNYQQNDIANEVIVKLSPTGKVCIATHARTHIVADTVGYIPT